VKWRPGRTPLAGAVQIPALSLLGGPARILLLAAAMAAAASAVSDAPTRAAVPPSSMVNPFIGTEREGATFPGAAMPFGMVQLSPDTGHRLGYAWSDTQIEGFSHNHLSGAGCPAMGDVSFMPTTGPVTATAARRYASPYSHDTESATPGSYGVTLERYGVRAELTATTRTGWHRYTFPATTQANVLVNVGDALEQTYGTSVRVLDDHTLAGDVTSGHFCNSNNRYTVHFVAKFSRPFTAHGTWLDGRLHPGSGRSTGRRTDESNGAFLTFDTRGNPSVVAKVALSYVDERGAWSNMEDEASGFDFDGIRSRAAQSWNRALDRIEIEGGSDEQQSTFYSALYRTQLTPTTYSDADGRYAGFDGRVHRTGGRTQYANLSLWDTYRPQNQLLELIAPRVARDIQISLLADGRQNHGWLPRWPMASGDTNVMSGDPATPFLLDGWSKGLLKGYANEAYRLLWRNATAEPPAQVGTRGREGIETYLDKGFVPYGRGRTPRGGDDALRHAGSATLEYALGDCGLGLMARALGHRRAARRLIARGRNYRTLWDPRHRRFRARRESGAWGPLRVGPRLGFHEGGPAQYQWLVPQDMAGVVDLLGGRRRAAAWLDSFFAYRKLSSDPAPTPRSEWISGPYAYFGRTTYNPNNEPDLHVPWAYAWVGQPWKTSMVVRAAQSLFRSRPDGLTGNDDLGTMSAWYVLSALGIYPVTSGTGTYVLNAPLFPRAAVHSGARTVTFEAPATATGTPYIEGMKVAGRAWNRPWIDHSTLLRAGTVHFDVGSQAGARWGTGETPPSPCH
jgi:predicted alpha-1,2-mannosidase